MNTTKQPESENDGVPQTGSKAHQGGVSGVYGPHLRDVGAGGSNPLTPTNKTLLECASQADSTKSKTDLVHHQVHQPGTPSSDLCELDRQIRAQLDIFPTVYFRVWHAISFKNARWAAQAKAECVEVALRTYALEHLPAVPQSSHE